MPFRSSNAYYAADVAALVGGVAGASAGVLSGVIVGLGSYGLLTAIAALLMAPLLVIAIRDSKRVASLTQLEAASGPGG